MHAWLCLERARVPDGSGIAAALDYSLKQQSALVDGLIDAIGEVRQGLACRAAKD